jgi:hypothetical protein
VSATFSAKSLGKRQKSISHERVLALIRL